MAEQQVNGLVIHVSSLNDRSTEVVMREIIRIGACEDCDVKIRLPQGATSTGPVACKEPIYGRWGGPPANKIADAIRSDHAAEDR